MRWCEVFNTYFWNRVDRHLTKRRFHMRHDVEVDRWVQHSALDVAAVGCRNGNEATTGNRRVATCLAGGGILSIRDGAACGYIRGACRGLDVVSQIVLHDK